MLVAITWFCGTILLAIAFALRVSKRLCEEQEQRERELLRQRVTQVTEPWHDQAVPGEDMTLDQLREACAGVESDPVEFTREAKFTWTTEK